MFTIFCCLSPSRKAVAKLLDEIREHLYQANHTWITSVRRLLRRNLVDGLAEEFTLSKKQSFLSFPVPECSCTRQTSPVKASNASNPLTSSKLPAFVGATDSCPTWMNGYMIAQSKEKESEEELEEDDSTSSGLFFRQSNANQEVGDGEIANKEDTQMEDNEELEGGDR